MRALLKPIIQPELGLVFLKPGKALLPMFGGRVLISTEPHEFSQLPSGALPAADQLIANDPRFQPFYQQDRVIRAAGGINALEYWVSQISACQVDGEHSRHMVTLRYGSSALRLCQSHDNLYTGQTLPKLDVIADTNRASWIVDRVRGHFLLPEGHQLTLPELCWWAVLHDLADLLPEEVSAASLRVKPYTVPAGIKREADITHTPAAQEIVAAKASKAIKVLKIDPEPPQSFMKIPKRHRWVNPKYLQWVKSQPCVCCGARADDPHHIIGHGQGGMGTKAHDLLTIPLCRQHHDDLHRDMSRWEVEHGSQVDLWYEFFDLSVALGAIS
ncbi:DUF968 domain-containing protein [Serratia fonticola]|uniref:DUF968 domain-containing protein n=1 Tax=Serratia fonticola TaxID=47917 RepID=UPI00217AFF23|nr:DUF968 domain-containing protein [Serratia fonticola]CAI1521212.1 Protein of uncharacterised function (DUF968) [Serratia fonticola]CAI1788677.1 Protein of uncharacterised function (DUF968) [Serratia fonticola]CAI1851658.1 Protein of uncharacterised function (DUF968) [Serratia fonticola]